MSNTVHKKILPEYFDLVKKGIKKFELRKDEDDIQVNDFLVLDEWNGKEYTGRYVIQNLLKKIRAKIPDVVLRTSLIVGFPGETENDFSELLDFIKERRKGWIKQY